MRSSSAQRFWPLFGALAISLLLHLALFVFCLSSGSLLYPAKNIKNQQLRVTLQPSISNQLSIVENDRNDSSPSGYSYRHADELTKPAQLIDEVAQDIEWPVTVGVSTHLTLRIIVGVAGNALAVNVLESTLPREVEAEIVKRFYIARYQSGEINKQAVVSEMLVSIDLQ